MDNTREIRHFHLFCGLGGGAKGFNRAQARAGGLQARGRCLGGIDVDPAIVRDFQRLAGVPGTVLDLFDRAQYTAWHGHEPPREWRESGYPSPLYDTLYGDWVRVDREAMADGARPRTECLWLNNAAHAALWGYGRQTVIEVDAA